MVLIDQNNIHKCTMLCPLTTLYGQKEGKDLYDWLQNRIASFKHEKHTTNLSEMSEKDAILITYADQFNKTDELPLQTLYRFGKEYLEGVVSGLHILPFSHGALMTVSQSLIIEKWILCQEHGRILIDWVMISS